MQAAGTQRHSCCELKVQGMFAFRLWVGHACRQQQRSAGFAVEWECRGAHGAWRALNGGAVTVGIAVLFKWVRDAGSNQSFSVEWEGKCAPGA